MLGDRLLVRQTIVIWGMEGGGAVAAAGAVIVLVLVVVDRQDMRERWRAAVARDK